MMATILVAVLHLASGDVPGMVFPGTSPGVPPSYDCAVRIHAWEFGKTTLPQRGVSQNPPFSLADTSERANQILLYISWLVCWRGLGPLGTSL